MRALIWAFVERIVPRAASALVSLLLAIFLTPTAVGLYSWAIVVLMLVQNCTDVAARQTVMLHEGTASCDWFLARYRWVAGISGVVVMLGTVAVLVVAHPEARLAAAGLLPIIIVPAMSAYELTAVVSLQLSGRWHVVARAQGVAATASLLLTVPLVVVTHSLVAAATQAGLSEVLFAIFVTRRYRSAGLSAVRERHPGGPSTRQISREFSETAGYALLGWGQSQADRAAIGAFAGTSALGLYSISSSVGRSVGEAAANASATVARAQIGNLRTSASDALRGVMERSLIRSLIAVTACVLATIVGSELVLGPLLGPKWAKALAIVPMISASIIPTLIAWNVSSVLQVQGRMPHALVARSLGLAMAFPIAIVAAHSLSAAADLVVVRDALVAGLMLAAAGRAAPWRAAAFGAVLMAAVVVLAMYLG